MPKGKIIFEDWPSTILAIKDHFLKNNDIEDFGNWKNYIHNFDPFRDGRGSYRIGKYLADIMKSAAKGSLLESIVCK